MIRATRQSNFQCGKGVMEMHTVGVEIHRPKWLPDKDGSMLTGMGGNGQESAHTDLRFEEIQPRTTIGIEPLGFLQ